MDQLIIGFSRAKNPWSIISKLIQVSENRNFSHAFIKYQDPITNLIMISQASHGMVHDCYIENFLNNNIIVEEYKIMCNNDEWLGFYGFNRKNQGTKYSTSQLLALAIVKLFHVKLWFSNGDKEFICSEWAARICKIVNKEIPSDLDSMTPSSLRQQLNDLNIEKVL